MNVFSDSLLGKHPVILAEKKAKVLYDKAVNNLAELYQKLGSISLDR